MAVRFNSFDGSRANAFVESKVKARNLPGFEAEGITPIIFILTAMRQVPMQKWTVENGGVRHWTGPVTEMVGYPTYDSKEDWNREVVDFVAELSNPPNNEYRIKPHWEIWLWQMIHPNMGPEGRLYISHLPLREGDQVSSISITDAGVLVPECVLTETPLEAVLTDMFGIPVRIKQILVETEPLMVKRSAELVIQEMQPVPNEIETAMHTPGLGERSIPGETIYWLPQQSLADLFDECMMGRPLDCRWTHPDAPGSHRTVHVRFYEYEISPAEGYYPLGRFMRPFIEDDWRIPEEAVPYYELIDHIASYTGRRKEPCADGGGGPDGPPVNVVVGWPGPGDGWLGGVSGATGIVHADWFKNPWEP